jgi:hypothetical protein
MCSNMEGLPHFVRNDVAECSQWQTVFARRHYEVSLRGGTTKQSQIN